MGTCADPPPGDVRCMVSLVWSNNGPAVAVWSESPTNARNADEPSVGSAGKARWMLTRAISTATG